MKMTLQQETSTKQKGPSKPDIIKSRIAGTVVVGGYIALILSGSMFSLGGIFLFIVLPALCVMIMLLCEKTNSTAEGSSSSKRSGMRGTLKGLSTMGLLCLVLSGTMLSLMAIGSHKHHAAGSSISEEFNVPVEEISDDVGFHGTVVYNYDSKEKTGALRLMTAEEDELKAEYYSFSLDEDNAEIGTFFTLKRERLYPLLNVEQISEAEAYKSGVFLSGMNP